MNLKTNTNPKLKWALLPLFLLFAAAVLKLLAAYLHTDRNVLNLTPLLDDPMGWKIYTIEDGMSEDAAPRSLLSKTPSETFYLTRTLGDPFHDGYTFLILDSSCPVSVFLDGLLFYTNCPGSGNEIGRISFPNDFKSPDLTGEPIYCSLPADSTGRELTIASACTDALYTGMPDIRLSSTAVGAEIWMSTANSKSMPAAALALAAVLLLGLLCFGLLQGRFDWQLLLLTASALCQMLSFLREYSFCSPGITVLDTPWAILLTPLSLLLPELFLIMQMKRWRKPCAVLTLICAVPSMALAMIHIFKKPPAGTDYFFYPLYISLFFLILCAVLELKSCPRALRLFLYSLGIALSAILLVLYVFPSENTQAYDIRYLLHAPQQFLFRCGIILFMLSFVISIFMVIRSMAGLQAELTLQTRQAALLDYELSIQKQAYEARLNNDEEIRALRHDMKGHLSTLTSLLSEGNTGDALAYLTSLTDYHHERYADVYCSNIYLNTVLGTFASRFNKLNIPFTFHVGIDNRPLPVVELCLIFNNALENALEASLKIPEEKRLIEASSRIRNGQFLLRVTNRFPACAYKERNGLPVSTKSEHGHGYGMANIRSAATKFGGDMHYRMEAEMFILDVYFPAESGALPQTGENFSSTMPRSNS